MGLGLSALRVDRTGESQLASLSCGHTFHPECLGQSADARASCPLCRAAFDPKDHRSYSDAARQVLEEWLHKDSNSLSAIVVYLCGHCADLLFAVISPATVMQSGMTFLGALAAAFVSHHVFGHRLLQPPSV